MKWFEQFNIMYIYDILLFFLGVYLLYMAKHTKETGRLGNLLAEEKEWNKAKNKSGFISYFCPKMTIFGGITFVYSVFDAINRFFFQISILYAVATIVWAFSALGFLFLLNQGKEKFF